MSGNLEEKTQWLDKALQGQPDDVRARVLEIILKYGIDPENEFFMIFVAIGQLQVLIEESPQDWQELFSSFKAELNQWTTTHLQTLEKLAQEAETTATLAQTSKELGSILTTLVQSCNMLMQRLQTSEMSLTGSIKAVERSTTGASASLEELRTLVRRQQERLESNQQMMNRKLERIQSEGAASAAKVPWVIAVIALGAVGFLGWGQYQQRQLINQMAEESQWQLQNIIRVACATGAKPKDAPECR